MSTWMKVLEGQLITLGLVMLDAAIVSLQIFTYFVAGAIGFILGRLVDRPVQSSDSRLDPRASFLKPEAKQKKEVKLDERKFVTTISMDSLTKKNGELGTSMTVDDNVSTSVSRLAQLKKSKQ